MTIARYVKGIRNFIAPYIKRGNILETSQRCCISIGAKEITLLIIDKVGEQTELLATDIIQYEGIENLSFVLSNINQKYLLSAVPLYWLLNPDDYQLFVMDTLPVKEEEFAEALKWRARSLINYPVEQASLDYFNLPGKRGSNTTMMALIAARSGYLEQVVNIAKDTNLNLTTIYIPELAMKNLAAIYETDEKCTAVIYFYDKGTILNISSKQVLYFTRRLNYNSTTAQNANNFEPICLDVLRYFDFFQSQWRLNSPNRIFVISDKDVSEVISALSQHLMLTVESFHIRVPSKGAEPFTELSNQYLLPYGCALREEGTNAPSRS